MRLAIVLAFFLFESSVLCQSSATKPIDSCIVLKEPAQFVGKPKVVVGTFFKEFDDPVEKAVLTGVACRSTVMPVVFPTGKKGVTLRDLLRKSFFCVNGAFPDGCLRQSVITKGRIQRTPTTTNYHFVLEGFPDQEMVSKPAGVLADIGPVVTGKFISEKKGERNLELAIRKYVGGDEDSTFQYIYNLIDLNGDGESEALVYVFGSTDICGTSGCRAFLLRKAGDSYMLSVEFGPARSPVVVSTKVSHGWKDLIFFNRGGGIQPGYYSVCRFDGSKYPDNPTVVDQCSPLQEPVEGVWYLADDIEAKTGIPLYP